MTTPFAFLGFSPAPRSIHILRHVLLLLWCAAPPAGSASAAVDAGDAVGPRPLVADDLAPVRTKDPQAADRIVSYCSKFTSATNAATVSARCRRDEMDAWTRLTVQNEFPNLDEASRRICSDPPFPNSFVALESCAKYQLHLD
jgi:hypothetical protein